MKKAALFTHAAALLAGAALGLLLAGCVGTTLQRLSGEDFIRQANRISELNSFDWTCYVGHSPTRAYLEYGYPAPFGKGTRTRLYWTFLSELPPDLAAELRLGRPPWKPWQPSPNKTKPLNLP